MVLRFGGEGEGVEGAVAVFIACWYKQPGLYVDMQVKMHHDVALVNVPDFRSGMHACFFFVRLLSIIKTPTSTGTL